MGVIVAIALVSTGLGLVLVAASHHVRAAYIGVLAPSGLWLGQASADRRRRDRLLPGPMATWLASPLRCLDDRMGDDMREWCDVRARAAAIAPQVIADAAQYYYTLVIGRVKSAPARDELTRLRDSIEHKIKLVRLVDLDSPGRLQTYLQTHPSTRDMHKYNVNDPQQLARRLLSEAQSELGIFLALLYRLGYHKILIYPSRSPLAPATPHGPGASTGAGPTAL
jgi:hypothetical protein